MNLKREDGSTTAIKIRKQGGKDTLASIAIKNKLIF